MMWSLFIDVAVAQDDPPEAVDTGIIYLTPVPELASALDTLQGAAFDQAAAGETLRSKDVVGALFRGRVSVHPVLDYVSVLGRPAAALAVGGALGHQLFTLDGLPMQLSLRSRLEATGSLAGARGVRLTAQSAVSPWFGPVGLQLGPVLRFDQQRWAGAATLDPALTLGFVAGVSLEAGPLRPHVSIVPAAIIAGDRQPADRANALFPVLLDETTWQFGLRWVGASLSIGADAAVRETVVGSGLEAGLSLHLSL